MKSCINRGEFFKTLSCCNEEKINPAPMLFLLLATSLVSAQVPGRNLNGKVPEVNQHCMDCICQASSSCDETLKCHSVVGGGGYLCGPYVVSWAYWYDGGRPGDKGKAQDRSFYDPDLPSLTNFQTCLTNRTCAEKAVRGYMRKYVQDCDASGYVDCHDFARIHKLGFDQCSRDDILDTEYWQKFEMCYDPRYGENQRYSYNESPATVDEYYYEEEY